jgi:hypothetical protein
LNWKEISISITYVKSIMGGRNLDIGIAVETRLKEMEEIEKMDETFSLPVIDQDSSQVILIDLLRSFSHIE